MTRRTLIPHDRLVDLLVRWARGEPTKNLAERFKLNVTQIYSILSHNRDTRLALCERLGVDALRQPQKVRDVYPGEVKRPGKRLDELPLIQTRACLKCRDNFLSWGSGNRLCGFCKKKDNWHDSVTIHETRFPAKGVKG